MRRMKHVKELPKEISKDMVLQPKDYRQQPSTAPI